MRERGRGGSDRYLLVARDSTNIPFLGERERERREEREPAPGGWGGKDAKGHTRRPLFSPLAVAAATRPGKPSAAWGSKRQVLPDGIIHTDDPVTPSSVSPSCRCLIHLLLGPTNAHYCSRAVVVQ